jgi:hypothetical protein
MAYGTGFLILPYGVILTCYGINLRWGLKISEALTGVYLLLLGYLCFLPLSRIDPYSRRSLVYLVFAASPLVIQIVMTGIGIAIKGFTYFWDPWWIFLICFFVFFFSPASILLYLMGGGEGSD